MNWEPVYQKFEDNWINHFYGLSIADNIPYFLDNIKINHEAIAFVCFKTKEEVMEQIEKVGGVSQKVGLAVGDTPVTKKAQYSLEENDIIYCTTGKMRNIALKLIKSKRANLMGAIFVCSWDAYDPNAYIIANIIYNNNLNNCMLALLSTSRWCHLPLLHVPQTECPKDSVRIQYFDNRDTITTYTNRIKQPAVLYGSMKGVTNSLVTHATRPAYYDCKYIFDTLTDEKGKPISKFLSDIRADSIQEGTVIRCVTEERFNELRDNDKITNFKGLDDAIIYLLHNKLDPTTYLGKNHPKDEITNVLDMIKDLNLEKGDPGRIITLQLGAIPGVFYLKWLRTIESHKAKNDRDVYIAGLIACLIGNRPTDYAPLTSYEKFAGRNDIETMCNMWSSLILSHSGPFWLWKNSDSLINMWCNVNGFYDVPIKRLVNKMKKMCLNLEGKPNLFHDIKTAELNKAIGILVDLYKYKDVSKNTVFESVPIKVKTLPTKIHPIIKHDKTIYMYIRYTNLVVPDIKAENVDLFYGM
jgi:hypothetical protein